MLVDCCEGYAKPFTCTNARPPPLISPILVLHPRSSPMHVSAHPDPDGAILGKVIETLDQRWDQFTRKRGTAGDSGVADLGVDNHLILEGGSDTH